MTTEKIDSKTYQGLAKNSLWVMVSNISMACILLLSVLASRILGAEVFGQYIFLLAITTVLADLSVLGTTDYAGILVARESQNTHKIVANSLGLRLPFILLFLIITELVAWFSMPETLLACFFIALDWGIRTVIHLLRRVLRARDAFSIDAKAATIERVCVLLFAAAALFLYGNLASFALGFLMGRLLGLIACVRAYRKLGERFYFAFDITEYRRLLKGGIPIGIRGLFKIIAFRVDAVMLGFFRPATEVGWYGAAYKFLEASFFFQEAIGAAVQPAMSKYYGQGKSPTVADIFGRGLKLLLIVGGLSAAIGYSFSHIIVDIVFGPEYIQAAKALEILVWAMLAVFCSLSCVVLMDAIDFGRKTVIPFAGAALINLSLNALLIPQFGLLAASLNTLISEVFLSYILLRLLFKSGYGFPIQWIFGPIVASIIFSMIILFFQWLAQPLIGLFLGLPLFFYLLVIFRVFDKVDSQFIRAQFLRKKNR